MCEQVYSGGAWSCVLLRKAQESMFDVSCVGILVVVVICFGSAFFFLVVHLREHPQFASVLNVDACSWL